MFINYIFIRMPSIVGTKCSKMKGIPVMDIFRYLFCLIFSDRSMYMQRKTGVFVEDFCKNTVYRFLNNTKTNWQRFTTLLSARIVNDFMKPLTAQSRKDVFIINNSLFDSWFSSPKTISTFKQKHGLDTIAMAKRAARFNTGIRTAISTSKRFTAETANAVDVRNTFCP